eukprot:Transcript_12003.p1 GENE.Transcript_12003~~Transcript_12003.p1  ORF type:complete len:491 (-),score=209.80 Transcript_12003:156-1628(-)
MTVSPTMAQEAMDTFLKSLGATDNPFTVEDLFDGRKDDVVWTRMQRVLNLDDATAAKLSLALKRASHQPAAPAAAPTPKQAVDAATANRINELVQAKPGDHTSIFGTDEHGRPVDAAGNVQKRAESWKELLPGKTGGATMRSGVAVSKKRALSAEDEEKERLKKLKQAEAAELDALPSTTIRMNKPPSGWAWRNDIKRAYENRAALAKFLGAGITDEPPVEMRTGTSGSGKEYLEFTNVTEARKAKLSAKPHGINFNPSSGGAQAKVASISAAWAAATKQAAQQEARLADRKELDAFRSVLDVDAAAVAEDKQLSEQYDAERTRLQQAIVEMTQAMSANAGDLAHVGPILAKAGKLQDELEALSKAEVQAKAEAVEKFAKLRPRVAARIVDATAPAAKEPRRRVPKALPQVELALAKAKEDEAKRRLAEAQSGGGGAAPAAPPVVPPMPAPAAAATETASPVVPPAPAPTAAATETFEQLMARVRDAGNN